MNAWKLRNAIAPVICAIVIAVVAAAVHLLKKPNQVGVIEAQSMDMSSMRPPTGSAPVDLAVIRHGNLNDAVTYTGTARAFNEQDITPRITGRIVSLPVYPGDQVRVGQLITRLDSAEAGARSSQAVAEAQQAQIGARVAELTQDVHHRSALAQAQAQTLSAIAGLSDARATAEAALEFVNDAKAGLTAAQSMAGYWASEIDREKKLVDAGAVSRQEYQNELAQAQAANAAFVSAKSKVLQADATARAAKAKVAQAKQNVDAARAAQSMAGADILVAHAQTRQAEKAADAANAAARQAATIQGYTVIVSPADGVVVERPVSPGTLVQPGQTILRIAEIDKVRVQANVAVSDLDGIAPGSSVTIALQGSRSISPITARVTSVFPNAGDQTRTAIVEAVIPNPGHRITPGEYATMRIFRKTGVYLPMVPSESIQTLGGLSYLWVARGQGATSEPSQYECAACHMRFSAADAKRDHYKDPMDGGDLLPVQESPDGTGNASLTAHRIAVKPGGSDGTWTEILSGDVRDGDRAVRHGQEGLTEGVTVTQTAWGADGPVELRRAAPAKPSGGNTNSMPGMKM